MQFFMMIAVLALGNAHMAYAAQDNQTEERKMIMSEAKTLTKEEQDVMNAISGMTEAFHAKDIEKVMSFYTNDAVIMFEPDNLVKGHEAIRAKFEQAFGINPKFTYSGHDVIVSGDTATHIAPWSMAASLPDGTPVNDNGLSIATLKKQSDGRWLMVIDNPHGSALMK